MKKLEKNIEDIIRWEVVWEEKYIDKIENFWNALVFFWVLKILLPFIVIAFRESGNTYSQYFENLWYMDLAIDVSIWIIFLILWMRITKYFVTVISEYISFITVFTGFSSVIYFFIWGKIWLSFLIFLYWLYTLRNLKKIKLSGRKIPCKLKGWKWVFPIIFFILLIFWGFVLDSFSIEGWSDIVIEESLWGGK